MLKIYEISLVIGFILCLIPSIAYVICWCWQLVWAWIDDSKVGDNNKFIEWLCCKCGYKYRSKYSGYRFETPKGNGSDGGGLFFSISGTLLILPPIFVAAFQFYSITVALFIAFGLAYVLRFARRLSKKFKLHTSDKDAHKG